MTKNNKPVAQEPTKEIRETKCTCEACKNTWYYGKADEKENKAKAMQNAGKALMCCGGCFPALLLRNKEVVDLNRCPKCGSKAVKKEEVIHYV